MFIVGDLYLRNTPHDLLEKKHRLVGGWANPSAKYEFVSWDYKIPSIWKNNPNVPKHKPE